MNSCPRWYAACSTSEASEAVVFCAARVTLRHGQIKRRKLPSPTCEKCGHIAKYCLHFYVATVGKNPRLRRTTEGMRLCKTCIREVTHSKEVPPLLLTNLDDAVRDFESQTM